MAKKASFLESITLSNSMFKHKGLWLIALRVTNIDLDMKGDEEQEAIMFVFQQIINSFNTDVQFIQQRKPVDFSSNIFSIKSNILQQRNEKLIEYGESYIEFLEETVKGKLDVGSLIIIKANRRYTEKEAQSVFTGIKNQLARALRGVGIEATQLEGLELKNILQLPQFIKEEPEYMVYGDQYLKTYVVKNYPHMGYPNWLKPLLNFAHPIQLTQHLHPFPKETAVKSVEMSIAKMESTVKMHESSGFVMSADLTARINDAKDLLERLVSGKDRIIETTFYVTISAPDLDELNNVAHELESAFRQIELTYRTTRKESAKALRSILPVCNDELMEVYTFDSKSLATLVPFTARSFSNGGIFYGICEEAEEIITIDRFALANPNKIILGESGYGKSLLTKMEIPREIINGAQAIVIDHNFEYEPLCRMLGGQYIREGDKPNWNSHMLVFSGDKVKALETIWQHITTSSLRKRLLIIDEFHNILTSNKELMLNVMREIRKYYTAPSLITQNIVELLRSDEGKMIMDLCSIKILMRQAPSGAEEIAKLFELSKYEKMYIKTCNIGHGYIFTGSFKTRFKAVCSKKEYEILTTNPRDKVGG